MVKNGLLVLAAILVAIAAGIGLGVLCAAAPALGRAVILLAALAALILLAPHVIQWIRGGVNESSVFLPENPPPVVPGSAEAADLSRQIAVLRLCAAELERRRQEDRLAASRWSSRQKVAVFVLAELARRLPAVLDRDLTPAEQKRILAEHPLLRPADAPPPDPSQRHAYAQWFQDIRAKVERFTTSRQQP